MKKVIIGGGEIGLALRTLFLNADDVGVFDTDPLRSEYDSINEALTDAGLVFVATPSQALPSVIESIHKHTPDSARIVVLSKGMVDGLFMHAFLDGELKREYAMLYGPMLAEEIQLGKPAGAVCAGALSLYDSLVSHINSDHFFVSHSDDVVGISVMSVLKNVYTLYLGMLECLEVGSNAYGLAVYDVIQEATQLVEMLHGNSASVTSKAGIADLIATARSDYSANKTYAKELVEYGWCESEAEGYVALPQLVERFGRKEYPLLDAIARIVIDKEKPQDVLR